MSAQASKVPIAALISGRGSNMLALADACDDPGFPARLVLVLSDSAAAPGLAAAAARGIDVAAVPRKEFPDRDAFEAALQARLVASAAERVCLAGFMRVLGAPIVEAWAGRMLNIHPSLLPSFKGLHTHRRALDAGVKLHGVTVHEVVPELDSGPIVAQAAVPVLAGDTEETLAARVLRAEHVLYPAALKRHLLSASVDHGDADAFFHPPV